LLDYRHVVQTEEADVILCVGLLMIDSPLITDC